MREIIQEVSSHEVINEETIEAIFLSIIKFQTSISNQCRRSYEAFTPQIETIFKKELEAFFSKLVQKQWLDKSKNEVEVYAVRLSWALYGATMQDAKIKPHHQKIM